MGKIPLLNTYVNNLKMSETIENIEKMIVNNKKAYVVAVNVDVKRNIR